MKFIQVLRDKFSEIHEEFRQVTRGHNRLVETMLPLTLFLLLTPLLGATVAGITALLTALLFFIKNLRNRRPVIYSLGGLCGLSTGILLVISTGRTGAAFLPNLGSNGLIFLLCLVSLPLRKPFAAWASYFARHYPLKWYWHPRVRPAYSEVTVIWTFFFGGRFLFQLALLGSGQDLGLIWFSIFSGWPAVLSLMVASYFYGSWRLKRLGGPGVDEFRQGDPPPWHGQKRGF